MLTDGLVGLATHHHTDWDRYQRTPTKPNKPQFHWNLRKENKSH